MLNSSSSSNLSRTYDDAYHSARLDETTRSAAVVVPLLVDLFPWMSSVVDFGCGTGAWLHQFQLCGVRRVLGLDGADVSSTLLQLDRSDIRRVDFREPLPSIGRFDLALSLDAVDCLPDVAVQPFIAALTEVSDVVVFSAPVPGQSFHPTSNERWASYWVALFAEKQFRCFDVLRERLWYDQRVHWCYSQNILIFASESRHDISARLSSLSRRGPVDVVHPRAFESLRGEGPDGSGSELKFYPFRLVEKGHCGYNILQIGVDKFLALAQSEGAYSPEKLLSGGYTFAYVAASVDEVKGKIAYEIESTETKRGKSNPARDVPSKPKDARQEQLKRNLRWEMFPARLLEQGYKGFNILQIGVNEFLALAQAEGAYSAEKLANGKYKRAYVASSTKEAKHLAKYGAAPPDHGAE